MPGLRVLVVENKELVAVRLKAQLEDLGHQVVGLARDGPEAFACTRHFRPDLIVMNGRLPILDGVGTARVILANTPVPIVLLTAYAGADFVRRARAAGVMAHLPTPVDRRHLGATIKVALARFQEFEAIRRDAADLEEALETRTLVEGAKRVIMKRLNLPEAEAFRRIQQQSRQMKTGLRSIASAIERAETLMVRRSAVASDILSAVAAIRRGLRSRARRPGVQAPRPSTSPGEAEAHPA